jgi:predicted nucleic acid-binding protein
VAFLWRSNVDIVDMPKELAAGALTKVTSGSALSFGDALILAQMQAAGCEELYSFDARFRDEAIIVLDRPAK